MATDEYGGIEIAVPTPTPFTSYSLGASVGGPDELEDSWTNKGYSAAGRNLTPGVVAVNTKKYPKGTIFQDADTGEAFLAADVHGNKNPDVVDFYLPPSQYQRQTGQRNLVVLDRVSKIPKDPKGVRDLLARYGKVPEGESAVDFLSGSIPKSMQNTDEFGGIAVEDQPQTSQPQPDEFGGIPVEDSQPDEMGGMPVEEPPQPEPEKQQSFLQNAFNSIAQGGAQGWLSVTQALGGLTSRAAGAVASTNEDRSDEELQKELEQLQRSQKFSLGGMGVQSGVANQISNIQRILESRKANLPLEETRKGWQKVATEISNYAQEYAAESQGMRTVAKQALPVDKPFADSLTGQVLQGLGQAASSLPAYAIPGFGPVASASQIYQEGYDDYVQTRQANGEPVDPAEAHRAALQYLPATAVDVMADKFLIGKVLKPLKGKMSVGSFVRDVSASLISNGASEGAQQGWLNFVANTLSGYDPERKIDQDVIRSATVGAIVGGGVTGIGQTGAAILPRQEGEITHPDPAVTSEQIEIEQQATKFAPIPQRPSSITQAIEATRPLESPELNQRITEAYRTTLEPLAPILEAEQITIEPQPQKGAQFGVTYDSEGNIGFLLQHPEDAQSSLSTDQSATDYIEKILPAKIDEEAFHISNLVGWRNEWKAAGEPDFQQFVSRKQEQIAKDLRETSSNEEVQSIIDVYTKQKEGTLSDDKLAMEFVRQVGQRARTGQTTEDVQLLSQAAQNGDKPAGRILKHLLDALQRFREVIGKYLNPQNAPQSLKDALQTTNTVLDQYGLLQPQGGENRAVQEQSAGQIPIRQQPEGSQGVRPENQINQETPQQGQTQEEVKYGPGAASITEPVARYEERSFGRIVNDEQLATELRESIGNRYYEPIGNIQTAQEAENLVNERGIGESITILKDKTNILEPRQRSAMGQLVIKRLNEAYRKLRDSNPKEAQFVLDQAIDLSEWQMEYLTSLGQGVQSASMWNALTPEGKLQTFQRAVRKNHDRFTKKYKTQVNDIIATANKDIPDNQKTKELQKLKGHVPRKTRKSIPELVKLSKEGKITEKKFYEVTAEQLGLPTITPEISDRIIRLAEKIDEQPEGILRDRASRELSKYMAQQKGFDVSDLPFGIYYGNILSGYNTHIVNAMDTFLNVVSEVNGLAMTNPRAATRIYGGMLRGLSQGKADALLALSEGRMATDEKWMEAPRLMEASKFGQKGGVPIKPTSRTGKALKAIAESKIAYPLNAYKYVTRALSASDAVMFRGAKEARAALSAYRMAQNEGLKGNALEERVQQILGLDRWKDFLNQAKEEGFEGTEKTARATELMEQIRDKQVVDDSADFAGEATYNHDPHGMLGSISKSIQNLSNRHPSLKLFVPFTRIVANVTNRGLNYSPYGFKRAAFGYTGEAALEGDARAQMLARATMGTGGLVLLGVLNATGLLKVHGAGPSDPEKRRQLQAAGWKPYSIQIGDNFFTYTYTPIGLGLSVVGNMIDSQRYNELSSKSAAERGVYALSRVGSTVFSQSFLAGLSNLFTMLSGDPGKTVSSLKNFTASTVSGFTTPNLVRDIHRLFDNQAYQANTIQEALIRNTPFASMALKPAINAFGEKVELPTQRFFSTLKSDPAWRVIVENNLRVPVPSRSTPKVAGGNEPMPPDMYYRYMKESGQRMKQYVLKNRTKLDKMNREDAQEALSKESERIHKEILPKIRGRK